MHDKDIQRWSYTKVYNSNICAGFDMAYAGDAFFYIFLCFELQKYLKVKLHKWVVFSWRDTWRW